MGSSSELTPAQVQVQARLNRLADRLDVIGRTDENFLSISVDAVKASLTIYRSGGPDRVAEDVYSALVPADTHIAFQHAIVSERQSRHLTRLVTSNLPWLLQRGIQVVLFGVDHPGEPYTVWHATGRVDAEVLQRFLVFGSGTLRFKMMPEPKTLVREADGVPFWGGAYIKGTRFPNESYGSRCSSGFGAHSSSNNSDYLLIPWHCLNEDDARVWNGGDTYMGKVLSNSWDPQYDVAYLKVPSANY